MEIKATFTCDDLKVWRQPATEGDYIQHEGRDLVNETTDMEYGQRVYEVGGKSWTLPGLVNLHAALGQAIEFERNRQKIAAKLLADGDAKDAEQAARMAGVLADIGGGR